MLLPSAPATRHSTPLPRTHPCQGCPVRDQAICGILECEELASLRSLGNHVRLSAGQSLFHEGDPATRVFTLTHGTLKLYSLMPDGRRQVTGFMHAGDFLGIAVDEEHAFTAEAVEQSQLCAFTRPRFDEFTEENGEMERELFRLATHELAAAQQQMILLGRKTASERVASFIVALARRAELGADSSGFVPLPMSRSDIADYLGLTKETISRVIAQLKRQRLIGPEALGRIEILDLEGLKAIAAGEGDE